VEKILQTGTSPHLCSKIPIYIPCHQSITENVLHCATKLNIQDIYFTRVSVCNQAILYRAQPGFGKGKKKSVSFTDSEAFSHKRPVLQNVLYVMY
jgi:hypothetical protein